MCSKIFRGIGLVIIIGLSLWSCSSVNSIVTIPANQQFILGELENSQFNADLENLSAEKVELLLVDNQTEQIENKIQLNGGEKRIIQVSINQKAIIKNNSDKRVKIKTKLNKSVEGMRYEVNGVDQKMLLKDSLVQDVALYKRALEGLHPGLLRYNTAQNIDKEFDRFLNDLPVRITEADFFVRLSKLTAKIKCGHTYLNPWNMDAAMRERLFSGNIYLPLGIKVIDGQFYVVENVSENDAIEQGAEIKSINGISALEIYEKLKSISKTDGSNTNSVDHYLSLDNFQNSQWEAFDIYFSLLYPIQDGKVVIKYSNYNKSQTETATITTLNKKERERRIIDTYGKDHLENKQWTLQIMNDDLAIMKIGTFAIWEFKGFDHKRWLDQKFEELKSKGIENLVIDIRGNGGGLTEPANELISYMITDNLLCNREKKVLVKTVKYDEQVLPHITPKIDFLVAGLPGEYYSAEDNGLYKLLVGDDCTDISPKENAFKGNVYIFGNGTNVSATYTLLDKAKENSFATYVGEASGGNLQGINGGEYAFFTMPYSKMEIDIPLKFFSPGIERSDSGVTPDVEIRIDQEDIFLNRDPYLNYVIKDIENKN
ncbi:S41 family peptidase [Gilvibacter sp.]|uniref:S41 family peptidase n=1 Tax=Gilvibacter sp. TaxID=2729997 RepID=UPI0025BCD7EF|nr:S41 family peptidase [Gilvibacter sp.]NQX77789.1 hypothetical protein [Gilvibacter sp.]